MGSDGAGTMRIYIDFDDVICETAKHFCCIAKELFDIDVPYQEVQFFNLKKSFDLDDVRYEETPGASETINKWVDEGHEVSVITGRPFDSYEPSRRWLDEHHLERVPLYCVDKYGREQFTTDFTFSMTLEQLYGMTFDFAVEDSPAAFEHVLHFDGCKVAIFNRPWNVKAELPNENFVRCGDWKEIDMVLRSQ